MRQDTAAAGRGRPPIDAFAGELNRAEAVRILLDAALVNAEQVDPGSTHGDRR
jgi:hypothetical protein